MKAIITVGVSASGKTTWAEKWCKENGWVNINRDDIRQLLFGNDYKFSKENEHIVTEYQRFDIKECAKKGKNIVISDTNLNKGRNKMLVGFLEHLGYNVEFKEFYVDLKEAIERDSKRERSVGEEVIRK